MRIILFVLVLISTLATAQINSDKFRSQTLATEGLSTADVKKDIIAFDIAGILTQTDNASVHGFIGVEYERIRMKFISVIKDKDHPDQYFVYGKNMVKDNVCEFQGTLKITNAYYFNNPDVKRGVLLGEYVLYENPLQKHVGKFNGVFAVNWYISKEGQILYDDLDGDADGFSNNSFVGTWTVYSGKISKSCNWGDHRIPLSGDFDNGTGEFHPDDKYVINGWQNYKLAYYTPSDSHSEGARKKEHEAWWK